MEVVTPAGLTEASEKTSQTDITRAYLSPAPLQRPGPERVRKPLRLFVLGLALVIVAVPLVPGIAVGHADNKRFNADLVANVYTLQRHAGCVGELKVGSQLQLAAQWHADDVLQNRSLDGDLGSDGSTPQARGAAAGYQGVVAEMVAINPALAISGLELIRMWYYDPASLAIMQDCTHTEIGVWSENSLDRTVVVAVYGAPTR